MAAPKSLNGKSIKVGDTLVMPIPTTVKVSAIAEDGTLTLAPGKSIFPDGAGEKFTAPAGLCQTWTPPK